MELSELKKRELRLVDGDFDGLKVVVNANAITGRFYRAAAEQIRKTEAAHKPEFEKRVKAASRYSTLQQKLAILTGRLQSETNDERKEKIAKEMTGIERQMAKLLPSELEAFEGRGKEIETRCDLYARVIKGSDDAPLLVEWDLTNEGEPVPCTVEELRKRHPDLLRDLYEFCVSVALPKSPETPTTATSGTISDSTVATTQRQDTPTDASLTM